METLLGVLSATAQHTAIPLFTMSVMFRCVMGPNRPIEAFACKIGDLLTLLDAFEPETAPLWESQIPTLEMIHTAPFPGAYLGEVEHEYAISQERFPEIFEGSTFDDWLRFCQTQDLVLIYKHRIMLSTTGKEFIENCFSRAVAC